MIDTVTVDLDGMPAGTTLTVKDIPEFQSDKIEQCRSMRTAWFCGSSIKNAAVEEDA